MTTTDHTVGASPLADAAGPMTLDGVDLREVLDGLPPDTADGARRLVEGLADNREALGYPRDGGPLTLAERKTGEMRNAEAVTAECVRELRGQMADDVRWTSWFYRRATCDRDLPTFAFSTVMAGCWSMPAARELVASAWSLPEWPEGNYGGEFWRTLFADVGYLHRDAEGDVDPDPPAAVPELWRGAIASRKRGLAWTSDRERAEWFADRFPATPGGPYKRARLWRLAAGTDPSRVLARFDGRGEHEWVVDVTGLPLELVR